MVANTDLETLTKPQLIELAKVRGVELPDGPLTKAVIIKMLRAAAAERKAGR